ncbi:MAG: histone deacetylase [Bacteroidia bacterium]|nr:histone deacetylase [Bacteroidia bacterium]
MFFYSDTYVVPLPENHRFPMRKYALLREQLIYEGVAGESDFNCALPASRELILCAHTPEYWQKVNDLALAPHEERKLGFPQSRELTLRSRASVGGTWQASQWALEKGLAICLAGGTHHAFPDRGEGFCVFNDAGCVGKMLLQQCKVGRVLIVDLDVHQGNGNAAIFADDDRVFTLSFHCKDNYPLRKEHSSLDVEFPAGTGDGTYLAALYEILPSVMAKFRPHLVYYIAGMDVLAGDRLGKFAMTLEGVKKRDRFVIETIYRRNVPLVIVMGGGYPRNLNDLLRAYVEAYRYAIGLYY